MDKGDWWATVHRVAKKDVTEHTHTHTDDYRELKTWFLVPNISLFLPTIDLGKLLNLTESWFSYMQKEDSNTFLYGSQQH